LRIYIYKNGRSLDIPTVRPWEGKTSEQVQFSFYVLSFPLHLECLNKIRIIFSK
jgi:hypothetical protein